MQGSTAMVKGHTRRNLMVTGCLRTVNPRDLLDLIKGVARLSGLQGRVSPFRADEVRHHHLDRRPATEPARPSGGHPRPRDLGSCRVIHSHKPGAGGWVPKAKPLISIIDNKPMREAINRLMGRVCGWGRRGRARVL